MENLPKDILFQLSLELDLPNLLNLCKTNRLLNEKVCNNENIWLSKLNKDFPLHNNLNIQINFKNKYKLLYDLHKLRNKLKFKRSVYELFNSEKLDLSRKDIQELPKEIEILQNLETLNLDYNQIKEIPEEIGKLTNLKYLSLRGNGPLLIPREIGKLTNLFYLNLSMNTIKELPEEIGDLHNLEILDLSHNYIVKLPKQIGNLYKLKSLTK
jgi:hypothetical protein